MIEQREDQCSSPASADDLGGDIGWSSCTALPNAVVVAKVAVTLTASRGRAPKSHATIVWRRAPSPTPPPSPSAPRSLTAARPLTRRQRYFGHAQVAILSAHLPQASRRSSRTDRERRRGTIVHAGMGAERGTRCGGCGAARRPAAVRRRPGGPVQVRLVTTRHQDAPASLAAADNRPGVSAASTAAETFRTGSVEGGSRTAGPFGP